MNLFATKNRFPASPRLSQKVECRRTSVNSQLQQKDADNT